MSERTVTVRLRAVIDSYQRSMRVAAGESKTFANTVKGNFAQLNTSVGQLGETMTRRVSLPLAGLGVGAVKLASDFETAFAQMVGLAGVAADEVDGLRDSVLKLSHETARGPTELAQALYFIRSSGIDAADAMGVLEVSAKASAAGLGSTVVVADAVTSAMNAYGAANLSAQQATDILVAAVREGKTEASELAPVLGTLIPTAAAMGISFSQVAGVLAVMSRTGLDAAEASTSLNAIFSTLLGTSEQGVQTLADAGLSLQGLRDMAAGPGGLVQVMRTLDETFKGNDEALSVIIPNVRAFRGVMNVMAQDAGSVDEVMRNVADSTGATNDAFSKMEATKAFEIKKAFADLQVTLIQIGAVLAPIAAQFGTALATLVSGFNTLPGPMKEIVVWLAIIAAASGPTMKALSLIFSVVGPAVKMAITALQGLRAELIASQAAGASYGQALGQMANRFAATAAAALPASLLIAGLTMMLLDNAEAARLAAQRQNALADAIKNTGSVAGGVAALIRAAAEANGFFAAAMAMASVSAQEVADAAAAGGPAWNEMRDRLIDAGRAAHLSAGQMIGLEGVLDGLPTDIAKATQHLDDLAKTAGTAATGAMRGGLAFSTFGSEIDEATIETQNFNRAAAFTDSVLANNAAALASLAAEATVAENAMKRLLGAFNAIFGAAADIANAQQSFADSLADVDSAAKVSGGSTRDLTSEQRTLRKATEDVTEAQEGLAEAEAALAEARKGATPREKKDASLDVRDAQLALKEAQQAVVDAKKKVSEEAKKGKSGDVKGARLDLERANLNLEHAQNRVTDAQAAQNKVLHSGEETSDNVKDALNNLKDAQERVTDATERQMDAEQQLRSESGGGPVADRARNMRGAYDQLVTAGESWIQKMIEQGAPTDDVIGALDDQRVSAQKLIDTYGDPDGKLGRFIDSIDRIRLIFTDDKFMTNFNRAAGILGGLAGVPIPDFLGSDATGLAHGGPIGANATMRINEQGDEFLTMGSKPGYVSTVGQYAAAWSGSMQSAASLASSGGGGGGGTTNLRIEIPVKVDGRTLVHMVETVAIKNGGLRTLVRKAY